MRLGRFKHSLGFAWLSAAPDLSPLLFADDVLRAMALIERKPETRD